MQPFEISGLSQALRAHHFCPSPNKSGLSPHKTGLTPHKPGFDPLGSINSRIALFEAAPRDPAWQTVYCLLLIHDVG